MVKLDCGEGPRGDQAVVLKAVLASKFSGFQVHPASLPTEWIRHFGSFYLEAGGMAERCDTRAQPSGGASEIFGAFFSLQHRNEKQSLGKAFRTSTFSVPLFRWFHTEKALNTDSAV